MSDSSSVSSSRGGRLLPVRGPRSASSSPAFIVVLFLIFHPVAFHPPLGGVESFLLPSPPSPSPPRSFSVADISTLSAAAVTSDESSSSSAAAATASSADDDDSVSSSSSSPRIIAGRAAEIASVALADVALPVLSSAARFLASAKSEERKPTWDEFWSSSPSDSSAGGVSGGSSTSSSSSGAAAATNAEVVSSALERLGPTYVKFGQALASRPDVVPPSLAAALSKLQDRMEPFDTDEARRIIREELNDRVLDDGGRQFDESALDALLTSLSPEPIAAASIGQVYRGTLPNYGTVAVKVQRPGIRDTVRRDFALLRRGAALVESLPAVPLLQDPERQDRLISTELVAAVDEFMSRIFEELDYRREASNAAKFASLYSDRGGTAVESFPDGRGVTVPDILDELCTENVLVMEWIEGTKLTDVGARAEGKESFTKEEREENLALLELAIQCTLSQLLDTGVMHADPHGGNLLKVMIPSEEKESDDGGRSEEGRSRLAYLDFGLLSTVPAQVRDGLVCAVAVLIFARDVDAVAGLFGELQLLPQDVLNDPVERAALREALTITLDEALTFPEEGLGKDVDGSDGAGASAVPTLKFDKLLDALTRLVPRFKFELPPYFVNNARALSTLEGIARSLDPNFNVLRVMYPYALNRMFRNPTGSEVVDRTLAGLIRPDGFTDMGGFGGSTGGTKTTTTSLVDRHKLAKLLNDSAAITGYGRTKVVWDVLKTRGGQRFIVKTAAGELRHRFANGVFRGGGSGGSSNRRRNSDGQRRGRRKRGRGIWTGDYFKL